LEELRRIREEAGLSQAKLARESGVDRATINKIEQGKRSPSIATLESLSHALAVEVADFFPKAQAPLPEMQAYGALLEKRSVPSEQIAAWLAQDEHDRELIAREIEKMSEQDFREALIATNPQLRRYYREHPPRTDAPPRSESA
jgi:transcriptional regulator with XRE-family HTH domain